MSSIPKQKIVTIHGIRTDKWYHDFKKLLLKRPDVEVINFDYGYFSLWKFLRNSQRQKVIKQFHDFYNENFDPNDPPSAVCHSFGTYIFFSSIRTYSAIKFNKVILCGSILARDLDWKKYFNKGQLSYLYNDFGGLDGVVGYSFLAIRECGRSGKLGFRKIPEDLSSRIIQNENYFGHSDYFFPLHIKENWIPKLVKNSKQFKYDSEILRPEIFNRIYADKNAHQFQFLEVKYNARIDQKGNYFAQYSKKGKNITNTAIERFSFITTADSREEADGMGFKACQDSGSIIPGVIETDQVHNKTCSFILDNPIKPDQEINISYVFKWRETMTFNHGDTDHFIIKNSLNVSINLNFKFTLVNPRFFVISDKEIISEFTPRKTLERDGTHSYRFEYINEYDYDGIIFYYESANNTRSISTSKELKSFKKNNEDIVYLTCSEKDIREVYILESEIEHGNAASEETLYNRLSMFPEGFIVAKCKNKVIGYIETVVWNEVIFDTFDDIKDFPLFYDPLGETLYVIFLGVSPNYRKRGVGERLLEHAKDVSNKFNVKKMQLVAKEGLEKYYENFNFEIVKELPHFLPDMRYKSTLMNKKF